ncbi:MAG: type I polyketide synthase, partial [Mycobacteriaceae bacterium]
VFDQGGALAADGRCKAFDAAADGIARGEGAGVVVLKRLRDAERDGDDILAVIAGSAVNSDGRSNGLMAPNPAAQADLLRLAYRDAGIHPNQVDYVEAHGTGTLLGDPIEAKALGAVLGAGRDADSPLLLGSAKTNFGHLEAAAGVAGLIKVVLAMQQDSLPPSLHFSTPNPHIPFDRARLEVVTAPRPWPRHTGRAVAGVSGFGFGGTNAHLVVREAPAHEKTCHDCSGAGMAVLALSAPTRERLQAAAGELADWLVDPMGREDSLTSVGRALARRTQGRHRAALVVQKHDEAVQAVRAVAEGTPGPGVHTGTATDVSGAVWVFSGYGSQWHGMARDLLAGEPSFVTAWNELEPLIEHEAGFSLRDAVLGEEPVTGLDKVQIVLFAVQIGLAAVLRDHGARPAAVLGHSTGEVAAAVVAGGLDIDTAVRVIVARSTLLAEVEQLGGGAMGLVGLSAAELAELAPRWPTVSAAVHAAPTQTTVAGERDEVRELVAHAESMGRLARLIDVGGAGHTEAVDPILGELTAELAGMDVSACTIPLFSSVTGVQAAGPGMGPLHAGEYWTTGVRQTVLFAEAVQAAVRAGFTTFVELSPHPVTLASIGATVAAEGVTDPLLVPTQRRKTDGVATLRGALAELHVHGHEVDLRTLNGEGPRADVPRTAWQHTKHWTHSRPGAPIGSAGQTSAPGVYVAMPDGRHVWQSAAGASTEVLVAAAATQVLGQGATVSTLQIHQLAPAAGTPVTTILVPHPGGGAVQVHARLDSGVATPEGLPTPPFWVLLAEAVVQVAPLGNEAQTGAEGVIAVVADNPVQEVPSPVETLRRIIAEVLGYASNKLPSDVPLTELGLDSLMAVRIKN